MTNVIKRPKVKIKLSPWVIWVLGALVLAGLGSVVFFTLNSSNEGWQLAVKRVGTEPTNAVIINHARSTKSMSITKLQGMVKALVLKPDNAPSLVAYDFGTKDFCGQGGCLFPIYEQKTGKLVADFLLLQNLPPGVDLLGVSGSCFYLNQLSGQRITTVNYCYAGGSYTKTSTQFSKLRQ
jgi:hypothetical protein